MHSGNKSAHAAGRAAGSGSHSGDFYGGGMSKAVEKWVLVTMLVAGALLLAAELVDQDWLGAALWALAVGIVSWLLLRHRGADSSSRTD